MRFVFVFILVLSYANAFIAQVMSTRQWRNSQKDSLAKAIRLLNEKKNSEALPIFETLLSSYPNEDFIKFNYAKCALDKVEKHEEAYRVLGQVYTNNKKIQDIGYYMALAAYYNNNFLEALNYVSNFLNAKKQTPELYKNADVLKQKIVLARYYAVNSRKVQVFNIGSSANSESNDINLVLTADENLKLFVRHENFSNPSFSISLENKYSKSLNPSFKTKSLHYIDENYLVGEPQLSNIEQSKLLINAISNDAHQVFFQSNEGESTSDIYVSHLIGNKLSDAKKLKGTVNTEFWEGSANLSSDGKILFFCSNRPGGKGGKDIYSATLSADSVWTNITNLGDSINTEFDEESPFLMPDGKTFYFSSKGWFSMGGFDIYKSKYNSKEVTFTKPENLSVPINSIADDLYFTLKGNGHIAYLSSNRKGGFGLFDLYKVETDQSFWTSLCLVKGKISYRNKAQGVKIKIEINGPHKTEYSTIESNELSGNYLACLPVGETYRFSFLGKGYKIQSFEIDLTDITGYLEKTKNISLEKLADTARINVASTNTLTQKTKTQITDLTNSGDIKKESVEKSLPLNIIDTPISENKKNTQVFSASTNSFAVQANNQESKLSEIKTLVLTETLDTDEVGTNVTLNPSSFNSTVIPNIETKEESSDKSLENNLMKNDFKETHPSSSSLTKNEKKEKLASTGMQNDSTNREFIAPKLTTFDPILTLSTKAPEKIHQTSEIITKNNGLANDSTITMLKKDSIKISELRSNEKTNEPVQISNETSSFKKDSTALLKQKSKVIKPIVPIYLPSKPKPDTLLLTGLNNNNERVSGTNTKITAPKKDITSQGHINPNDFSSNTKAIPTKKYTFTSKNPIHLKTQDYIEKYGDFSVAELEYKIQITAFKKNNGYDFSHLANFGTIREVQLGDGFTRLEIGPTFKTLREAFELNKRIVEAGQPEAYVVALYKGKRYAFEELEFIEVYK